MTPTEASSGAAFGHGSRRPAPARPDWRPGALRAAAPRQVALRLTALLLAHALLVVLLQQALRPSVPPAATGPRAPALVWLDTVWPRTDAPAQASARRPPANQAARSDERPRRPTVERPMAAPAAIRPPAAQPAPVAEAQAVTLPSAAADVRPPAIGDAGGQTSHASPSAAGRTEAPASRPLNLALPRSAASAPPSAWASQDGRTHSSLSAGERFALTLGTAQEVQVQDLNGGARRWRRGAQCVETRPAREGQINPMGGQAAHLPQQASGC